MAVSGVLLCGPFMAEPSVAANYAAPPLGPHRLAAWLRAYGHRAEVYDFNLGGDFRALLESRPWDIIGFSSLQVSLPHDIKAARLAKEICPGALIIFGGLEATLNPQDILDCAPCDLIALGEGEKLLLDLAEGKPLSQTSGFIWRSHAAPVSDEEFAEWWEKVDFAAMGYPCYWAQTRALSPDAPAETINTIRLVTSSHCNKGCAFCSATRWHAAACGVASPVLALSPEEIYRLVCKAMGQVPEVESFYFCEDDFIVTRERAWEAFTLLGRTGKKFLVQTCLDKLDEALIRHMARNGCFHVTLGIESASEKVRRDLGKPLPGADGKIPRIIRWCGEVGIRPYLLFILFCPTATLVDLWENYEKISAWQETGATISIEPNMRCYRGSPLWDSGHEMRYEVTPVWEGPARAARRNAIRWPERVLPDDPAARAVAEEFNRRWPAFLAERELKHEFKGATGRHMLALLGQLLEERK